MTKLSAPGESFSLPPRDEPREGHMTASNRTKFCAWAMQNGLMPAEGYDGDADAMLKDCPNIASLKVADDAENTPIHMWQIYSAVGHEILTVLIASFYDKVFDDTANPWFRNPFFFANDKPRHIFTQQQMWLDVGGGGLLYEGSTERIEWRHSRALEIMTT